jgi:hypothetical protein
MPEIIGNMRENYEKWKEYHVSKCKSILIYYIVCIKIIKKFIYNITLQELGITTLDDIEKLQQSPELQIYKKVANN